MNDSEKFNLAIQALAASTKKVKLFANALPNCKTAEEVLAVTEMFQQTYAEAAAEIYAYINSD